MNEKLIKTLLITVASFVVFIIIIFGISSCTNKKRTYSDLEDKMLNIAKEYFKENAGLLPKIDNKRELSIENMIQAGKLKSVESFLNIKGAVCKGYVTVYNNNGNFIYIPSLNCGSEFKTVSLKEKIIEDNLTDKGVGLYESNGAYIMKGEVKTNYVSFNNILFRIVRINNDDSIKMIEVEPLSNRYWDNRFNPDLRYNSGINEYIYNNLNSRVKDYIEENYKNEKIWPASAKAYIKSQDLCIGKRSANDTTKDGSTECSNVLHNQQFGLLAAYEYLQASLDPNCVKTTSAACSNYNWYASFNSMWTLTANMENTSEVYEISKILRSNVANIFNGVNVVVNLVGDAVYSSGSGTLADPYIIK